MLLSLKLHFLPIIWLELDMKEPISSAQQGGCADGSGRSQAALPPGCCCPEVLLCIVLGLGNFWHTALAPVAVGPWKFACPCHGPLVLALL